MQKIPATVITGFLGAGKTTLIRHMLANAGGRRIALIINEFGDLGVDGEILKGCANEACTADDIIELANGCICCTVADDFIPTIETLLARPERPDHIVIETSGLALPQPLLKAFAWPQISASVTVDGVITVVDGPALADGRFASDEDAIDARRQADPGLDHESPLEELFEDQLNCADMVLLNKADLLDEAAVTRLKADLKPQLRSGARLIETSQGKADVAVLLGLDAAAENDRETRQSHHELHGEDDHDHDDFETFVLDLGEFADQAVLINNIKSAIQEHDILRIKGYAALRDTPARLLVQAVGPRLTSYFDRPWHTDEPRTTSLVIIGRNGLDAAAITRALAA